MLPSISDSFLYAHTKHGFNVKSIIDVEKDCLNTYLYMHWIDGGIFTTQMDTDENTFVHSSFACDQWTYFKCDKPVVLKVKLNSIFNTCRNLKKKDELVLCVEKSTDPKSNFPFIEELIISPSHGTSTNSSRPEFSKGDIVRMPFEAVEIDLITEENDYPFYCTIQPQEWHKLCRNIQRHKASSVVFVIYESGYCFFFIKGTFAKMISPFGIATPEEDKHAQTYGDALMKGKKFEDDSDLSFYKGSFSASSVRNTGKMNNMGNSIVVKASPDDCVPICIKSRNNHLGEIEIITKSLEQIAATRSYEASVSNK